ncbi:cobaltochelatase subunit CobN [Okeania sp. SIO2C9]|uniref:cobaltochelatase subunit CobN n=1 Tax=Okeania sp. SIO2C9 TaxID=2607791 RepID=UPI0025EEB23E|nr:cobaltochelatase subunit CobN [Okeania sp. SIO2C9]
MHRIAATPGGWNPQAEGVIFIEQTPAPIIFLTAADTDIQTLAAAVNKLPSDFPPVRVANLLHLQQQLTIDTYADDILSKAEVIILRLLGGRSYWSYGLEVLQEALEKNDAKLIVIPGDDRPDPDLMNHSNISISAVNQLWRYLTEAGVDNFVNGLQFVANICLDKNYHLPPPISVPRVGIYPWQKQQQNTKAKIGILFYRAHYLSGNVAPIDALCQALTTRNLEPVPVFVSSPRDLEIQEEILQYFQPEDSQAIQLLLNTTSFAVSVVNNQDSELENLSFPPLLRNGKKLDIPVLQVIFSGGNFEQWESQFQGLSPRDVAMNVALPEVDGNIISRAVSFKAVQTWNSDLETDVVSYLPVENRIAFVTELAANFIKLRQTPVSQRRIALILANYPNRDGRLANGVGLDTPASCVEILQALQQAGYNLENIPETGDELIKCLTSGVTNDLESRELRSVLQSLSLAEFETYFTSLPEVVREKIIQRWGKRNDIDFGMAHTDFATDVRINSTIIPPSFSQDISSNFSEFKKDNYTDFATDVRINSTIIPPSFSQDVSSNFSEFKKDSEVKEIDNFPIPGIKLGNIFVGIQPSRGYDIDPSLNYHAPDLEPTPNYLAFYYWLREKFKIDAIIHVGKHGNLEWLPGKSVGLSQECFPEITLGALPHFYPFIVNDPGEGSQAKRRSQAVIIDHLTPPMTRAEIYGALQQLETLIDEYYEAQNLDPSRLSVIRERIINLIEKEGLDKDLSFLGKDSENTNFATDVRINSTNFSEFKGVTSDSFGAEKDSDFLWSSEQNQDKFVTEIESLSPDSFGAKKDSDFLSLPEQNQDKFVIEIEGVTSDSFGAEKDSDFLWSSEQNQDKFVIEIEGVTFEFSDSEKDSDFLWSSEQNQDKFATEIESLSPDSFGAKKDSDFLSLPEQNQDKFVTEIESLSPDSFGAKKDSDFLSPSEQNQDKFVIEIESLSPDSFGAKKDSDFLSPSEQNQDKFVIEIEGVTSDSFGAKKDSDFLWSSEKNRDKFVAEIEGVTFEFSDSEKDSDFLSLPEQNQDKFVTEIESLSPDSFGAKKDSEFLSPSEQNQDKFVTEIEGVTSNFSSSEKDSDFLSLPEQNQDKFVTEIEGVTFEFSDSEKDSDFLSLPEQNQDKFVTEIESLSPDFSSSEKDLDFLSPSEQNQDKFVIEIESLSSDFSSSEKDLDFLSPSEQNQDKFVIEIESLSPDSSSSEKDLDFLSPSEQNQDKFVIEIESLSPDSSSSEKDLDFLSPSEKNREKKDLFTPSLHFNRGEKFENDENARFAKLITNVDGYLCELKEAQIRDGLHIFGQCPQGQQLRDLIIAIARHPSTTRLGLTRALAEDLGLDFDPLTDDFSTIINQNLLIDGKSCRTLGNAVEVLEEKAANLVENLINQNLINSPFPQTNKELEWIRQNLLPSLQKTNQEIINLLIGLDGKYIPSGSSGAPTRGRPDVLPTGRNFYSVDIRAIPTETAWRVGQLAAENLIERYTQENGEYPQTLGLSVWGTSTMRTGGDDIAEALALLGVKPVWDRPSRRVIDFEILPISILGRPRVDVTLRISGFFRDAFPNIIDLFDQAVIAVANLDESPTENPLAAQVKKEVKYWQELGLTEIQAKARSQYRIFGSKPGAYGAGLQGLIESQNWQDDQDLARAYINWSSYAYTGINNSYNQEARAINSPEAFSQRLQQMQIVLHNQDNREHDLLDSDDYYQFQGGMTVAIRALTGKNPDTYFGDNSMPENPKVRQLKEQITRVYRSRVVNPKWIAGVMRHGYKGAFEMAATIDYLFAYDATAKCVEDFMYQGVAEAYIFDENVQSFIHGKNPWALRDMAERLLEANQRGLWQSANQKTLEKLRAIALEAEGIIENLEFRI